MAARTQARNAVASGPSVRAMIEVARQMASPELVMPTWSNPSWIVVEQRAAGIAAAGALVAARRVLRGAQQVGVLARVAEGLGQVGLPAHPELVRVVDRAALVAALARLVVRFAGAVADGGEQRPWPGAVDDGLDKAGGARVTGEGG